VSEAPVASVSEAPWHQGVLDVAPVSNQEGQRSTSRRSNSSCIWRLFPAGGTLGIPHESRSGNRGFQVVGSSRLKLDGFNDIGDPDLAPVLKC
jgi:hypothetical protein